MLIRLINSNGTYQGVIDYNIALQQATQLKLSLIKIASGIETSVYKLCNQNKHAFTVKKKQKIIKKNSILPLKPKIFHIDISIDTNDCNTKVLKIVSLLAKKFLIKLHVTNKKNKGIVNNVITQFNANLLSSIESKCCINKKVSKVNGNYLIILSHNGSTNKNT